MCILFYIQKVRLFLGHTVYSLKPGRTDVELQTKENCKITLRRFVLAMRLVNEFKIV